MFASPEGRKADFVRIPKIRREEDKEPDRGMNSMLERKTLRWAVQWLPGRRYGILRVRSYACGVRPAEGPELKSEAAGRAEATEASRARIQISPSAI
jgi:hypothetical protein